MRDGDGKLLYKLYYVISLLNGCPRYYLFRFMLLKYRFMLPLNYISIIVYFAFSAELTAINVDKHLSG